MSDARMPISKTLGLMIRDQLTFMFLGWAIRVMPREPVYDDLVRSIEAWLVAARRRR